MIFFIFQTINFTPSAFPTRSPVSPFIRADEREHEGDTGGLQTGPL